MSGNRIIPFFKSIALTKTTLQNLDTDMRTNYKTKLQSKILVVGLLLTISFSAVGQADFNSTKDQGVSLNYYTIQGSNSVFATYLYRTGKNCFFGGFGIRKDQEDDLDLGQPELEFFAGYRRYSGKNHKQVKFFYQSFLYYSFHRANIQTSTIPSKFITLNIGLGVEYDFAKRFSASLSSDVGRGWDSAGDGIATTLFPAILSFTYKFNRTVKL